MENPRKRMNIIPLRTRLDREKKKSGITFDTIQQDYLLSWLLFGLYEHPSLKDQLIFKGGTALKSAISGTTVFPRILISLLFRLFLKKKNFSPQS